MTTWVLLRGLMREQRHWGDFPQRFAAALPGTTVVTPDLPGNGQRYAMDSPTQVAGMLAFCRADLLQRGLPPPYALLALSLGGMLAAEWSARHPQEIIGSVLINTSMRPYSRFHERLRWRNYPALARLLPAGVARREQGILRLTSARHGNDGNVLASWLAYQQDRPVSRINALRQLLAAARYRAPPQRPPHPVLVLAGGADRLVDVNCSRRLAQAWDAPLLVHPDAGHDVPLDDAVWVIDEILRWQRQQVAPAPGEASGGQGGPGGRAAGSGGTGG